MVKIIECPRDAMQGLKPFIPTETKIRYINALLKVGFDTIDFGSFVSPKAIPQMRDTAQVVRQLDLSTTKSKLLCIVANRRGAEDAVQFDEITYLGYPFSISETFQMRNTNATIEESLDRVAQIQELCLRHHKKMLVYISMGFGNPYGDPWNVEIVQKWVNRLVENGIQYLQLSDTIGVSNPDSIAYLFSNLIPVYQPLGIEIGAHLHTTPTTWREKIQSAWENGCTRFDGAIRGFGGCPMAKDELTGNMPTENMVRFFRENNVETGIDFDQFQACVEMAASVFPIH
ncbi:MAG: hydroxymethylglutaryl-CoA lyase [Bacteroidetes bacterium]|nr:MAG: hydroxymethylglutaryl-CoA lyase [Bacteroidota bacterium]